MPAKIFLSYASEDRPTVEPIYDRLAAQGFSPWMDCRDILPGEDWKRSIWRTLRDSDLVVVCLSQSSVDKRGFMQREIKQALEYVDEMLEGDIYLIPVRLEKCNVLERLSRYQWADLFANSGWVQLREAISEALHRRDIRSSTEVKSSDEVQIVSDTMAEEFDGIPGYDLDVRIPTVHGLENPDTQKELNHILGGFAMDLIMHHRRTRRNQIPELFNWEMPAGNRSDQLWVRYAVSLATSEVFSLALDISDYGAGAPHP